ncbi:Arc family DNA-binding protein [Alcaligenes nematophilus]
MARTDPQVNFRMPQELREMLDQAALENSRTLTAEIVARLLNSFDPDSGISDQKKAVLRVLTFEEMSILMGRVDRLGGATSVLNASAQELKNRLDGPLIQRDAAEEQSYYSRIVGKMPLTSVLTTTEIDLIAKRVVALQKKLDPPSPEDVSIKKPTEKSTKPRFDFGSKKTPT